MKMKSKKLENDIFELSCEVNNTANKIYKKIKKPQGVCFGFLIAETQFLCNKYKITGINCLGENVIWFHEKGRITLALKTIESLINTPTRNIQRVFINLI